MEEKALYKTEHGIITKNDFIQAFQKLGIEKGDTILVHSDISPFGRLALFDREQLLQEYVDALKEVVGQDGTIVMPTITDSWWRNEVYDPVKSKSTTGVLPEHFRTLPDVKRTLHPTHSAAVWGKHTETFMQPYQDTFGEHSTLGLLQKLDAKNLFIGVPFRESFEFGHYVEQKNKIPYRYMRKLKGTIKNNDELIPGEISFFTRYVIFFNDNTKFEHHLKQEGLLREEKVGNGTIQCIPCRTLTEEGTKLMQQDPYIIMKQQTGFEKVMKVLLDPLMRYFPLPLQIVNYVGPKIVRLFKPLK